MLATACDSPRPPRNANQPPPTDSAATIPMMMAKMAPTLSEPTGVEHKRFQISNIPLSYRARPTHPDDDEGRPGEGVSGRPHRWDGQRSPVIHGAPRQEAGQSVFTRQFGTADDVDAAARLSCVGPQPSVRRGAEQRGSR